MLKWTKAAMEQKPEVKYWEQLETAGERRSRIRSLYIVHTAMLVFSLGFSVVLTGLQPYMKRLTGLEEHEVLTLFGWMVAINPLGQMLFSPLLGWLSNRLGSIRIICLFTCGMYIIGNVLYSTLSLFPDGEDTDEKGVMRYSFMFVARLFVGISSANQAPIRAYVAGATWKHERNLHISILSLYQSLGFMIGPALQSALVPIGCSPDYNPGKFRFDMYTIAGWISAGVGLISLILFLPGIFTEHYVAKKEAEYINTERQTEAQLIKPDLLAVISCTTSFFVFLFNFILLETIGTPLCMEQLGWSEEESIRNLGILMSVGAVVSMVAYGTIGPITAKIDERLVYIFFGLLPMMAGRVAMIPMGQEMPKFHCPTDSSNSNETSWFRYMTRETDNCNQEELGEGGCCLDELPWCEYTPAITDIQFYVGYAISAISFPYCMAICQAMFSKVIGPRPQGVWMGLLTSVGSLARICGPLFVSAIYVNYGTYWTFGLCTLTLVISTVVTGLTYFRLIPIEERMNKINPPESIHL